MQGSALLQQELFQEYNFTEGEAQKEQFQVNLSSKHKIDQQKFLKNMLTVNFSPSRLLEYLRPQHNFSGPSDRVQRLWPPSSLNVCRYLTLIY